MFSRRQATFPGPSTRVGRAVLSGKLEDAETEESRQTRITVSIRKFSLYVTSSVGVVTIYPTALEIKQNNNKTLMDPF
jgi:hypothetical protein